jgi:hypothetical protein
MSAHAVAAASGCCCAPSPTPCTCIEYGTASSGVDFERLEVSGAIAMDLYGVDCCGAELRGNAMFGGATIFRQTVPFFGWTAPVSVICPQLSYPPIGDVIGSVSSTVGLCTYRAPCCPYTGCPQVERTVTHSALPWFWCAEEVQYVNQDICAGVLCSCDEGGIPCGGNCLRTIFDPYPTAMPEEYVIALTDVEVRVCPIGTAQAQSWLRIACTAIPARVYRGCESCVIEGPSLPLTFNLVWVKECRYPGDTVKGTYHWSNVLNGGPPSQVTMIDEACQPDLIPGGSRKLRRTLVASPVMVIS